MAPPAEQKDVEMAAATETEKKEPAAKPEPPKELEEDAKKDSSPKIKETVEFLTPDTTLNVMRSSVGGMLMPLSEGGLSQLVAGARASVGVKAGRYMFETKIVEQPWSQQKGSNFVRVGFSTEGSLYLGEDANSICFDSDGGLIANKKRTKCSQSFSRDVVVAVVLNLDEKSPNFNTVSLFRDGKRAAQPQALPEELKGKALFPSVSFKGCTVHVNFAAPVVPLPFKCNSIAEASQKAAVVTKYDEPADGKYTVLFPVSLPDEGTFDWLDSFLEKNPNYTELSDRAFADWAAKSGVPAKGRKESNDKPGASLDDLANIKKTLMDLAAMQPRNFVIMEVRGNLMKEDREAALAKFKGGAFKTTAEVIIGDTPSSFKRIVQAKALKFKQDGADREHRVKFVKEKGEWQAKKRTKDMEKARKRKEKEMKKKAEEIRRKQEVALAKAKKAAEHKKAVAEAAAKGEEAPAAEEEEEEKEEEKPAEESDVEIEEADEPEPEETTPATVSLTAEEKAVRFFKHPMPDMTSHALATAFPKFTLPEDSEFDAVKYSWGKEKEAAAYVKKWIFDKKQTTPVEDIVPSAWFKTKAAHWVSESSKWKNKQNDYRSMISKKAAAKRAKADRKLAAERKAKMEADKKEADEKKKAEAAAKAAEEGKEEEKKEEEKVEEKVEEKAPMAVEESEDEPEEATIDFDGVDVFGAEDICDIGNKVPLFRDFGFEDFAMMSLRFELNLLVHSFGKDCQDPDRQAIHLDHLAFYYQKYFGKALIFASFGVATAAELVALVNDTIVVNKDSILEAYVPTDLESDAIFAKMTEAARRHRNLRVDMGDESAKLKVKQSAQPQQGHGGDGGQHKRAWKNDAPQKGAGKFGGDKGAFMPMMVKGYGGFAGGKFGKGKGKAEKGKW